MTPLPQVVEETLPALQKLKEQGLIRFIGFTGLPLKVYRSILDRCAEGACKLMDVMLCVGQAISILCACAGQRAVVHVLVSCGLMHRWPG